MKYIYIYIPSWSWDDKDKKVSDPLGPKHVLGPDPSNDKNNLNERTNYKIIKFEKELYFIPNLPINPSIHRLSFFNMSLASQTQILTS